MNTQSSFRVGFSKVDMLRRIDGGTSETVRVTPDNCNAPPSKSGTKAKRRLGGSVRPFASEAAPADAKAASVAEHLSSKHRHRQMGFVPTWPRFHRAYNCALAFAFIVLTLPLMLLISGLLLVTQGTSIFYRGTRVGRDGDHFEIVKFRTLDSERAAELTRNSVLPPGSNIETPLGFFLRETRLDELPQLFNVLWGDMNFCGPRPVRPEIANELEGMIPGYSERFSVKPGLLGPTQACTNHGASKQVRARFNAKFLRNPVCYRCELSLIALVGACVFSRAGSKVWGLAKRLWTKAKNESKSVERAQRLQISVEDSKGVFSALNSLNDDEFVARRPVAEGPAVLKMTLPDGRKRHARISVLGPSVRRAENAFAFRAEGDYSDHILTRYFHERVVVPHRSRIPFLSFWFRRQRTATHDEVPELSRVAP